MPHVKEPQHKKEQEPVPAGKDEFGDGVQVGLLVMVSLLVGFEKQQIDVGHARQLSR